jgi:hypothetical protein
LRYSFKTSCSLLASQYKDTTVLNTGGGFF